MSGIRTAFSPFNTKKEPFKRDEILYQLENSEITAELPAGVYYLAITGGGGTGGNWYAASGVWAFTSGGSGATWEGSFRLRKKSSVRLIASGPQPADSSEHFSKLIIDGVEMIVCRSGASTWWGHNGGPGGTLTVNSALEVVETVKATNGNNGSGSVQGLGTGGASTSSYGWGAGTNVPAGQKQTGGALLKYLRSK
nr:MAG TPA: hypothetical protein [Caudoviricetes sp.]